MGDKTEATDGRTTLGETYVSFLRRMGGKTFNGIADALEAKDAEIRALTASNEIMREASGKKDAEIERLRRELEFKKPPFGCRHKTVCIFCDRQYGHDPDCKEKLAALKAEPQ